MKGVLDGQDVEKGEKRIAVLFGNHMTLIDPVAQKKRKPVGARSV
jgi:hypothetical protein